MGGKRTAEQSVALFDTAFITVATLNALVVFGRVHEVLLFLGPLRLGMLASLMGLASMLRLGRPELFTRLIASGPVRAVAVTVAVAVVGVPQSIWPAASFKFLTDIYYQVVIMFVLAALAFQDRRASRIILIALIVDVVLGSMLFFAGRAGTERFAIGYTYDPNDTASFFLALIPWAIYLALSEKGALRLLAIVAIPLSLIAILKTGSRGGIVGIALLVPFLLYLSPPKRRAPFILALTLGAVLFGMFASADQSLMRRFAKTASKEDYNFTDEEGRVAVWTRGMGYFRSNPFLGVGVGGFPYQELESKQNLGAGVRQTAAHSMYVQVSAELGVPGILALMSMLFGGMARCAGARRRVKLEMQRRGPDRELEHEHLRASMAMASLWTVATTGVFLSLGYSAITYYIVGAAVGVSCTVLGRPEERAKPQPLRLRGMRGWRSSRPVPSGVGVHGLDVSQS